LQKVAILSPRKYQLVAALSISIQKGDAVEPLSKLFYEENGFTHVAHREKS